MQSPAHPEWPAHYFEAMGGTITFWLDTQDEALATAAFRQAEALFREAEARFSRFDPQSELSRINRAAGNWTQVSGAMWAMLDLALSYAAQTGGLFDPTLGATLIAAGYDRSFEQVEQGGKHNRISDEYPIAGWQRLEGDSTVKRLRLPQGMRLDLGGIVKGHSAGQAAELLGKLGPALVDASGDIAASAPPRDLPGWPLGIAFPASVATADPAAFMWLGRGGLATSGIDRRRWQGVDGPAHHLIDPRSGRPAQTARLSASVLAADIVEAEVYAKLALIAPEQLPPDCAWMVFNSETGAAISAEMARVLQWKHPELVLNITRRVEKQSTW